MFNVFFGNIYFWLWVPGVTGVTGETGDVMVFFFVLSSNIYIGEMGVLCDVLGSLGSPCWSYETFCPEQNCSL